MAPFATKALPIDRAFLLLKFQNRPMANVTFKAFNNIFDILPKNMLVKLAMFDTVVDVKIIAKI